MTYGNPLVNAACLLLILAAVALSPLYAVWVGGGWIADQLEKRR